MIISCTIETTSDSYNSDPSDIVFSSYHGELVFITLENPERELAIKIEDFKKLMEIIKP